MILILKQVKAQWNKEVQYKSVFLLTETAKTPKTTFSTSILHVRNWFTVARDLYDAKITLKT